MGKYRFMIPAAKYFAVDAERLAEIEEGDVCEVLLDTTEEIAVYWWRIANSENTSFWEDDDYEGALEVVLEYFGEEAI